MGSLGLVLSGGGWVGSLPGREVRSDSGGASGRCESGGQGWQHWTPDEQRGMRGESLSQVYRIHFYKTQPWDWLDRYHEARCV